MRILFLISALALLVAAQWAIDPSVSGYRGWTVTANGTLPTSFSATVQLLPTPYWQEWIIGNWTTAFTVGRGCTVQAGPLRYGIYAVDTAYVETPPVKLGQNFTIVVTFKPRYSTSDPGFGYIWVKTGPTWVGEMAGHLDSATTIYFDIPDAYNVVRVIYYKIPNALSSYVTAVFVGMYVSSQNTYYWYLYVEGTLVAQSSFTGQRGAIASSVFRLGSFNTGASQQLWYVAFAVYNRSLTSTEVASLRPESPTGNSLVMYYYAHPQFVRDIDGDGVLEWLDLSGNNRHAELKGGATPQWFVGPAVLSAQQCGGATLSAQWDGFTATYAVNGTQRSTFEPGRVYFDGLTSYAVVPISFYGWQGLTIEQYVYVPPCKPNNAWSKSSMYGNFWVGNATFIALFTLNVYCNYWLSLAIGYRPPNSNERNVAGTVFPLGRWHHLVVTFNKTTLKASIYVNGTLVSQGTWDYPYTIFDYKYSGFYLGSNVYGTERTAIAYAYVRIYSRELSQSEILQNLQNPNSPVTRGLEVWLHWDSFRGGTWLDKSGKGRHATVYGNTYSYPHWQWVVGVYLQHGYPAASPLVMTDLRLNGISWSSGVSRGGAVQLMRVDGAYVDAGAYSSSGWSVSRYAAPNSAFGFDAVWTPSDVYRGWITLWRVGATALNITQIGGHGVSINAASVRGYAGTVAAVLGDGLYVNGTKLISIQQGANATSFALLPSAQGGLRALIRYAWLDAGVRYGANSSLSYGGVFGRTYTPSPTPSPWAYYVDFRWWPPVATWGILQNPPITAVRQRQPSQVLTPVAVSGSPQVSASLWGPFGEVCLAQGNVAFGVKYAWLGTSAPTCVLPGTYTASGSVQTASFNSTAPVQLYFASPPVQHPYVANSVPGARFCSLNSTHFSAPYLPLKAPGSTVVSDQWACAPSDYFVGGYVAQSAPGWGLIAPVTRVFRVNTTSVVYAGPGSAVLARGGAVPALSVRAVDGRTWNVYTSVSGAVASAGPLQTPPNISRTGGAVSGVFGVPRSPTTLISQWWGDGVRYYISAAGLADAPVVYISSFTGSPVAVPAELNAPSGYSYYVGVLDNGTYVWAVPLSGPMAFNVYVPAPGYYTVRLYRDADRVWERNSYLSPDTKLTVGPVDIAVFTPVNPVSLYTPAAPKPPVFVPAVSMQMPPYAVGILMLGVFAAAYISVREISLASLITGAVVTALGVLINAPIYGVAGVFLLAFGLWNKARRQSQ
jgi:hypothetical protein